MAGCCNMRLRSSGRPCLAAKAQQQRAVAARAQPAPNKRPQAFIHAMGGSPMIAPRTAEMGADPYGLLLQQRTVILGGEVSDFSADAVISQLLLLDAQNPNKDIKLFINSPGGSVTAGMGVYDAIKLCRADVQTYCFGLAASMGAFLLGAGTKGKRYSMPNARIMIHQPLGGASGQAIDVEIQAREMMYHKTNINRIMSEYTGQTVEQVEADTDRDRYMSPLEAKKYGIIDEIIGGDEAGYQIKGDIHTFTASGDDEDNPEYGDPERLRGERFRRALEPYVVPLAPENIEEMD